MMRSEKDAHTLQPTALVHEAYLRLADSGGLRYWQDRGRIVALASQVMEHILIEHARGKKAIKRGGKPARVELEDVVANKAENSSDVQAFEVRSPD